MSKFKGYRINQNELGAGGRANQLLFTDQKRVYIGGNNGVPEEIGYVRPSITISTGSGLTGGGDLSANRTISLSASTISDIGLGVTAHGWGDHASAGYAISGTGGSQVRTNTQLDMHYVQKWESWDANLTVTGNAIINGNLYVQGTEFISNTETVEIEDNLALINAGEQGNGVTSGFAGWEIDRGQADNFFFGFAETPGYFQVGKTSNLQTVATREDSPIANGLAIWNNTLNRFDTQTIAQLDLATRAWVYDEVPAHLRDIRNSDIDNWNEAHSWGDHAIAGYATASQLSDYVTTNTDQIVSGKKLFFQVQNKVFNVNELTLDLTGGINRNIYRLKNDADTSIFIGLLSSHEWTGEILVIIDMLTHAQDLNLDIDSDSGNIMFDSNLSFLLNPGYTYLVRLVSCGEYWHATYTQHII